MIKRSELPSLLQRAPAILVWTAVTLICTSPARGGDSTGTGATEAEAADANPVMLDSIMVTSEKRVESVHEAPISMQVDTGDSLQTRGITDFSNIAIETPGVSMKTNGPGQTEIEMRGMTSSGGNSPTVGFYLDDIALTAPAGAQNGKVVLAPPMYDISRVEVLRGPQGTLYGSGSMGGTVKVITTDPDLSGYHGSAQSILSGTEHGGFNYENDLMINIPVVSDKLAVRVVATDSHTSGWIDRIVASPFPPVSTDGSTRGDVKDAPVAYDDKGSNSDQYSSLRATALWKPTEHLAITAYYAYLGDKQAGISAYDSTPGTLTHYQPFDIPEPKTDKENIFGMNVTYSFDTFDATLVTDYWNRRSTQIEDGSEDFNNPNTGVTYASNNGLPTPSYYGANGTGEVFGYEDDPTNQYSNELRFVSTTKGSLNWVAGAYFSHFWSTWNFSGTSLNPSAYMDLGTLAPATTTAWFDAVSPTSIVQYAVFGNATYAFTKQLKLTVGLRWNAYEYGFDSTITGWGSGLGTTAPSTPGIISISQAVVEPKFNLSYDVNEDLMAYATVAEGFRPGGGNAQYPVTGAYWSAVFAPYNFPGGKWPATYKSDSVWNYEMGTKAQFLQHRLEVDASVYYEDWKNIQLLAEPGDWALNINGKKADIGGGDIDTRFLIGGGFTASLSAGYTHVWVDPGTQWQIAPADALPDVPQWNGNASLSYSRPISRRYTLTALAENAYVGSHRSLDFRYGFATNGEYALLPSYDLTNLRIGIESMREGSDWSLSLFVNNAFNKQAKLDYLYQETLPAASFDRVLSNQPRTAGADLSYRF